MAGWLLHYDERKADYLRRRANALLGSNSRLSLAPGHSSIGDPTGRKGERLLDLEAVGQWLELVEEVEVRLPQKMQVYLRVRRDYRSCIGRRGWVSQMQRQYAAEMSKVTGKQVEMVWVDSRQTFWVWWERIVEFGARLAAKRGLL